MKKFYSIGLVLPLFLLSSFCTAQGEENSSFIVAVDSLVKVFPDQTTFPAYDSSADVAINEHASFQFAVRNPQGIQSLRLEIGEAKSGGHVLKGAEYGFIGYVKVSLPIQTPPSDVLRSDSKMFPDPILNDTSRDIPPGQTEAIWVTYPIPPETAPGTYKGTIVFRGTVDGKEYVHSKDYSINVFPVKIGRPRLLVTNWFFYDAKSLSYLNDNKPVEKNSDVYWESLRKLARIMKSHYQNVAWLSPLEEVEFSFVDGRWHFDFSNFDRFVQLFIDEGVVGRIEGQPLAARIRGEFASPFAMLVPVSQEGRVVFKKLPPDDPATQKFYGDFLPALMAHLKEKKWDTIYMQHIVDEPSPDNAASYAEMAGFVKSIVPEIRTIEAAQNRDEYTGLLDVWVPRLDFLADDYDFFVERQKNNDVELWFYTSCGPQGDFANRFIEQHLLNVRYLHWINFQYGATGYLHWGLNVWYHVVDDDPMGEITQLHTLPAGDCWIVYPYKNEVVSSIRFEAMRDGIVDYELLKMLEEKNPVSAKELCGRLIKSFTSYEKDTVQFRQVRREILEALSN